MATSMGPGKVSSTSPKGAPVPTNYGALSTLVTVFFFGVLLRRVIVFLFHFVSTTLLWTSFKVS